MLKRKKLVVTIEYEQSKSIPEEGIYYGGIVLPKFIDELEVCVNKVQDFDLEQNRLIPTGKFEINITGTRRSLFEFGKSLINLSKFDSDDSGYHEHIEGFASDPKGPPLSICIHKAKPNPRRKSA